uniref:G-protein coupled receptors family 1 profile domain-containing protein n=1 Tax=Paramormyrops kingsleyae TaxID=1676925 RepID=A0A3B3SMV4_9TELE
MNVSSSLEQNVRLLDKVKAGIHWGSFITTTVFSYMVVTIVHRTPRLRNKLHYVLLCQHCFCISGFNVTGALLHTMLSLHMAMPRIVCWLLFGSQVALARGLMLTLTLMALNICLCVCWPLRYREIVHTVKNKAIMGAWLLALLSPVVFTGMACAEAQEGYLTELDPACHTPMEGWASLLSAAVLLGLLTLLIMLSYVLIYKEGRRVGHFSDANSRGCRTILIHGLQISLHILPGMLIIARLRLGLVGALVVFVVFSLAQSVSPVVYGLRCQEIRTQLPRLCCSEPLEGDEAQASGPTPSIARCLLWLAALPLSLFALLSCFCPTPFPLVGGLCDAAGPSDRQPSTAQRTAPADNHRPGGKR